MLWPCRRGGSVLVSRLNGLSTSTSVATTATTIGSSASTVSTAARQLGRTMLVYGSLFSVADVVSQTVVMKQTNVDWSKVRMSALFGGGPNAVMMHAWLLTLAKWFPRASAVSVACKVALDGLLFTPVYIVAFFIGTSTLAERQSFERAWQLCQQQFFPTWGKSLTVWPFVQTINFWLVSPAMRPIFVGSFGFAWTIVLMCISSSSTASASPVATPHAVGSEDDADDGYTATASASSASSTEQLLSINLV